MKVAVCKILEIGNYPPPFCGWAMHTQYAVKELRRRGVVVDVLKLNEGRQRPSPEYINVRSALDYFIKVFRAALDGYTFHVHLNGESWKMYLMVFYALAIARGVGRPGAMTFHGGLPQKFFPRPDSPILRLGFKVVFFLAGKILCNSNEIARAIMSYGVPESKVTAIPPFSSSYLDSERVSLPAHVDGFFREHDPVFLCYVSFRPEYRLNVLRTAMKTFRETKPAAGFIWVGFPARELVQAQNYVNSWSDDEVASVLVLGNRSHGEFLTLLSRCTAAIRTPACDGVSASVLESLSLGIPVVASENGRRPPGVITYQADDALDLTSKLNLLLQNYLQVKQSLHVPRGDDNIARIANWILDDPTERQEGMLLIQ